MKAQVIGIGKRRSGIGKKSGKPYDGTTIYCIANANDVKGAKTYEIYLSHLSGIDFPPMDVGDNINLDYDDNKQLVGVEVLAAASK